MDYSLKVDWLNFVFMPTDEDIDTFNSIYEAFLHYFPNVESILEETFCTYSKRYYNTCLSWNDGILFCWDSPDNINPANRHLFNSDDLTTWQHGFCVQIPSHGLHYLKELLGVSVSDDVMSFKPVIDILYERHCRISRLDLAFDDFTKTFVPRDFLNYWNEGNICSPCKFCSWFEAGKGGGSTFNLGARSNKMLRIYDKEKESRGEIKSTRYEIECHNKYAAEICDSILDDSFNFIFFLEKWFIKIVEPATCDSLKGKRYASMRPVTEEWQQFVKSAFGEKRDVILNTTRVCPTMKARAYWLKYGVAPAMESYIRAFGVNNFLEMVMSVIPTDKNINLARDTIRTNFIDTGPVENNNLDILKIVYDISDCIANKF